MVTDRDPLEELVGALARVRDDDLTSAPESAAAKALFEEIVSMRTLDSTPPVLRRRRLARPRLVAVMVVGLLFLLTAGGYAASRYLTPNEQLSVFDRVSRDIPLPPGGNFDLQKRLIQDEPAYQEEVGLAGTLAFSASCQWMGYWLDGYNRADAPQMSAAAETIDEIPTWPQLANPSVDTGGPGGIVALERSLATSVDAGVPALVRQFLSTNCEGEPWATSLQG
jgi:hypothetical protein